MRQFTHGGDQYLLGRSERGYGIWLVGLEQEEPIAAYPGTDEGWRQAWAEFTYREPDPHPLGSNATAPVVAAPPAAPPSYGPPSYAPPPLGPPSFAPPSYAPPGYTQPGFPVPYGPGPGYPMAGGLAPQGNGMATTGGTLGIVGAALSLIPLIGIFIGLVMGVLAIIFGGVGMSRANRLAGAGKGMAVTGLVLGILTVIFKLIPGVNLI